MPTPNETAKQYGQQPFYYVNGLGISNNATTPNTQLDIAAGTILDSTATYQIGTTATITINGAVNGLNGLDTGALAASKVYSVYLVADPVNQQITGAMISLSATPLLPFGYSAFALIGYIVTDASVHFLKGYWTAGDSAYRKFIYDAPQATAVTAGHAVAYTAVDLSALVPAVNNLPVSIAYSFTPNAATTSFLKLQGVNETGDAVKITGQVAAVPITGNASVFAQLTSSLPKINYTGVSASDATALNVAGYDFIL